MEPGIFGTIIGGLSVFLLSQFLYLFVFKPIVELKETIAKCATVLMYFANIYMNPGLGSGETFSEMNKEMRMNAGQLRAKASVPLLYWLFRIPFGSPSRENIIQASKWMIGISNITSSDKPEQFKVGIAVLLEI